MITLTCSIPSRFFTFLVCLTLLTLPTQIMAGAGNALQFDGVDDYVELAEGLSVGSSFTIEMWVNPGSTAVVLAAKNTEDGGDLFKFGYSGVGIFVDMFSDDQVIPKRAVIGDKPAPNTWTHLAATVEKVGEQSRIIIYQDGVSLGEKSLNVTLDDSTGRPWLLGQEWDGDYTSDHFKGQMDEVRFWNRVLTREEIEDGMNKSLESHEQGLVAYYRFDENLGFQLSDLSSNGHDGTLKNYALQFDGVDDYVELAEGLSVGSSFTIEMWVNPATTANQCFVGKNDGSKNQFLIGIYDGNLRVDIEGEHSESTIAPTGWHHLAVVVDGSSGSSSSISVYLDGEKLTLDNNILNKLVVDDTGTPWTFGMEYDGVDAPSDFFNGQLGEVRFWNKTLIQEEIQDGMDKSLVGDEQDLVAYYRFDENSGYKLSDYSLNSHNGTLKGFGEGPRIWVLSGAQIYSPVVETGEVSYIWTESTVVSGTIRSEGDSPVTTRGFCWWDDTTSSPPPNDPDDPNCTSSENGSGNVHFSTEITGLIPGKEYFFRAFATNSFGTLHGAIETFKTLKDVRTVPDGFTTIQEAIDASVDGDGVLIKDGTYSGSGNINITFGGKQITVRSENGPEYATIDCNNNGRAFEFASGETSSSVVQGFKIVHCNGDNGGAVYALSASPIIQQCVFENNISSKNGGAIYVYNPGEDQAIIRDCMFSRNTSLQGGGIYLKGENIRVEQSVFENNSATSQSIDTISSEPSNGGAIYGELGKNTSIRNSEFSNNYSSAHGGAVYIQNEVSAVTPTVIANSIFSNNSSNEGGGLAGSGYFLVNSIFYDNQAYIGGGIHIDADMSGGYSSIVNCTITGNEAQSRGGGISRLEYTEDEKRADSSLDYHNHTVRVLNTILWNNFADGQKKQIYARINSAEAFEIGFSNIEGGLNDITYNYKSEKSIDSSGYNIDTSPKFALQQDYHLVGNSPCINEGTADPKKIRHGNIAGLPLDDADGSFRIVSKNNNLVDIGAYEYDSKATVPHIAISPTSFSFDVPLTFTKNHDDEENETASPQDQGLEIRNTRGRTDLAWKIEEFDCEWLTVEPTVSEEFLNNQIQTISLQVDPANLDESERVHSCNLVLTGTDINGEPASNSPILIPVTFTLNDEIYVSSDGDDIEEFTTIQGAIDAAVDGDTVIVRDGNYSGPGNHDFDFKGKNIVVKSESGPDRANIDLSGASGRAIRFHSGEGPSSVLTGFTFTGATAGAISITAASSPTISNCVFDNNTATFGGAIQTYGFGVEPIIYKCTFNNNIATRGGGAILNHNSSPNITYSSFNGNKAKGVTVIPKYGGGAIRNFNSLTTISYCTFKNNTSKGHGGAISDGAYYRDNATYHNHLFINGCSFVGNKSDPEGGAGQSQGGGVYSSSYEIEIINSTFSENSSEYGGGGLFLHRNIYQLPIRLYNNTFVNNSTKHGNYYNQGGGVQASGNGAEYIKVDILNCIFSDNKFIEVLYNNTTNTIISDIELFIYDKDLSFIDYSFLSQDIKDILPPVTVGENNKYFEITNPDGPYNPKLENFNEDGYFKLKSDSPCIDAGIAIPGMFSDQRGSLRPIAGPDDGKLLYDIGAIEYANLKDFDGSKDETLKAFKEIKPVNGDILVGYEYKLSWELNDYFSEFSGTGIFSQKDYKVRFFLMSDYGTRIDLLTTTQDFLGSAGPYSLYFTFGEEHRGVWHLGMELVADTHQFLLSDESPEHISISNGVPDEYLLGEEVKVPEGIEGINSSQLVTCEDINGDDLCYWDPDTQTLFAVKKGVATVKWPSGGDDIYPVKINIVPPKYPQMHIINTPKVNLKPEGSEYDTEDTTITQYFSDGRPESSEPFFQRAEPGYTVLHYKNTETETFEVVKSVPWHDQGLDYDQWNQEWHIGTPIEPEPSSLHKAEHNGFVLNFKAPYDGYGDKKAHDRDTLTGPIIPVNVDRTVENDDDMVVVWYQPGKTGVSWPHRGILYNCKWPDVDSDPSEVDNSIELQKIVIENDKGSGPLSESDYGLWKNMLVYSQPNPELPGFNPNEEHALLELSLEGGDHLPALFALRNDLNKIGDKDQTSAPYALLKYRDPAKEDQWAMEVFKVIATESENDPVNIQLTGTSGKLLKPPYPLNTLYFSPCENSGPASNSGPYFKDKNFELYAAEPVEDNDIVINFFYPLRSDFYYDSDTDDEVVETGDCISWDLIHQKGKTPMPVNVTYEVDWPADPPVLQVGDTLMAAKNGLPEISNQCSVDVLYGAESPGRVKLIDPMITRAVDLDELPEDVDLSELPIHLSERLTHNASEKKLKFTGYFDDTIAGEPLLLPNIISYKDQDLIKQLLPEYDPEKPDDPHDETNPEYDGGDEEERLKYAFLRAVDELAIRSRCLVTDDAKEKNYCEDFLKDDQEDDVEDEEIGTGLTSVSTEDENYEVSEAKALSAAEADSRGNILLVFNNCEECTGPVDLQVIKVGCPLYSGEIKVFEPENVFDNRVTLRHTNNFGGRPDEFSWVDEDNYQRDGKKLNWLYAEYKGDAPPPPPNYADTSYVSPNEDNKWYVWPGGETFSTTDEHNLAGDVEIVVEGPGDKTLADKWFISQYKHSDTCGDADTDKWSEWTAPQLYQGWIKRVMAAINLYDQKVKEFHENEVNTVANMITQVGEGYEGDAALTYDPEYLNSLGLIQFYQTIFNRGKKLTIDAAEPEFTEASNQQLLLAANRLSDLYMLLGNEAYGDAIDPTIGFGSEDQWEFGTAITSLFCFQNQVSTLLDEELALLRGMDDEGVRPFYNRLVWNFSGTEGEVAYQQNYNIRDENLDGEINEYDGRYRFPQGHGDAWGYYLSALKNYYALLRHPSYTWEPKAEAILIAGTPVNVDYEDERKFARAASAKARTGVEIVDLTYRKHYQEDPADQLLGYKDDDPDRGWGVNEWATRSGQGAYFDWVVGNAMLPAEDTEHEGIQKVDRTMVMDLAEIETHMESIQVAMDKADSGLNPLGLAKGAVPFDIDPTFLDVGSGIQGETHFEQIYDRALAALENAVTVFDHANFSTNLLRRKMDVITDFKRNVVEQELEFTNRLIEVYGYPYSDDCGPGKTYPTEYCDSGPDIYHYMYVDRDLKPLQDEERSRSLLLTVPDYDAFGSSTKTVPFNYVYNNGFTTAQISKPSDFDGSRKAPGELQLAMSDLYQLNASYTKALEEHANLLDELEDYTKFVMVKYGLDAEKITVLDDTKKTIARYNTYIRGFRTAHNLMRSTAEFSHDWAEAYGAALLFDVDSPWQALNSFFLLGGSLAKFGFNIIADAFDVGELGTEHSKEHLLLQTDITLAKIDNQLEFQQALLELENLLRSEIPLRTELLALQEAVEQAAGQILALQAKGERILRERLTFRQHTAALIQDYRYRDMAFRIFENDALQKYRSQLDMAGMYIYLAAKAYDYETALLDSSSRAGKAFLSDIIRQRSIGRMEGGEPLTGSGLADSLKRMWLNFQVLEPQMGFNNPQVETNRFSLREEMFRIRGDQGSDTNWQQALRASYVDDLWEVPEFRRYCRPFSAEGIAQPGLVIPFSTTVTSGLNFFGWPLGPGDSYYSAANFATKARSVGVWFNNYDVAGLAETPRVYLVPVGADVLRAPAHDPSNLRVWNVLDQKIPQPMPIAPSELDDNPGWIPLVDTLYDELYQIRRHSDFRAYPDSGWFDESEMSFNSRLIGRSVYNDRWLLIIPGQNLLYDGEEGINRFIEGHESFYGSGERTGNGVKDIKLFFHTYSYSGN